MEALDWLFQQFPSYQLMGSKAFKPTLDNSRKILTYLDHPEKHLKFVHVAGSNGKGSVSSYLASILTESGLKVGLFTSPHIAHFSERIRVNGQPIEAHSIDNFVERIRKAPLDFSPSFFEITFGMALEHFQKEQCDICIIEAGLGGRLDATNVLLPELSIITSISLEHTDMLGDTFEAIAGEKAGIIKANVPVVLGQGCLHVRSVFDAVAQSHNAPIAIAHVDAQFDTFFRASYQRENFACVIQAIRQLPYPVSSEDIRSGIEAVSRNTGYYGRLQQIASHPTLIYDVAHNADGIKNTLQAVSEDLKGELHIIYGSSKDKDLASIKILFPENCHFYGTEFSNSRSLNKSSLQAIFGGTNFKSSAYFSSPVDALKVARDRASEQDTILVLGSFFLLSDFF